MLKSNSKNNKNIDTRDFHVICCIYREKEEKKTLKGSQGQERNRVEFLKCWSYKCYKGKSCKRRNIRTEIKEYNKDLAQVL